MGKVIYGINWALRTFDSRKPDEDEMIEKAQETAQAPKSKEPKKKAVVIEVMPGEPMPEGYADYRPFLQRDGLILLAWELYGDDIRIIWFLSNGSMHRYQTEIDEFDSEQLSTVCPDERYDTDRWGHRKVPDFIIYAAPPDLTANTKSAFIGRLKANGVTSNLDYKFSLGRQKQEEEKAVADKIHNCNFITAEEAELLEVYRQLSNEGKTELIKRMESLLNEQERKGIA